MKAWLKGGLWGLILGIIFDVIYVEYDKCPVIPPGSPQIAGCGLGPNGFLFLLVFIVIFILVGAFIGWIIRKNK